MDIILKNVELVELHTNYATVFLEYVNLKDDLIEYICFCCNKNYQKHFMKI